MNKGIIHSATTQAVDIVERTATHSHEEYMELFINTFAEILANDLISVVGHHAVNGGTATEAFAQLKRIYCDSPILLFKNTLG